MDLMHGLSRRQLLLGGTAIALAAVLVVALWAGVSAARGTTDAKLQGTDLGGLPAPAFALPDQSGQQITLQRLRGHPVVLTFLDSYCPHAECPLMAQYLAMTSQQLGGETQQVQWVALSMNPADSQDSVKAFLKAHPVPFTLHYLLGNDKQLTPLWKAYHMQSLTTSNGIVVHTTGVYVIDKTGRERVYLDAGFDPRMLASDLHLLLQTS